ELRHAAVIDRTVAQKAGGALRAIADNPRGGAIGRGRQPVGWTEERGGRHVLRRGEVHGAAVVGEESVGAGDQRGGTLERQVAAGVSDYLAGGGRDVFQVFENLRGDRRLPLAADERDRRTSLRHDARDQLRVVAGRPALRRAKRRAGG